MSTQKSMDGVRYNRETAHHRNRLTGRRLDWTNQPALYKQYANIEQRPLPPVPELPAITMVQLYDPEKRPTPAATMDVTMLAGMLALAYGPTAKSNHGGQVFLYRSAPSAGALYPAEIYLLSDTIAGLAPGLYHYPVQHHALTPLRQGVFLRSAAPIFAYKPMGADGVLAAFFITGIFFRSAWKYGPRAYRYVLLDVGHVIENLVLTIRAMGFTPQVHYDFDDVAVGRFLGLASEKEAAFAVVTVAAGEKMDSKSIDGPLDGNTAPLASLPDRFLQAGQVAPREQTFDSIAAVHGAGCHAPKPKRAHPNLGTVTTTVRQWYPLAGKSQGDPTAPPLAKALKQRRSRRNFIRRQSAPVALAPTIELLQRWYAVCRTDGHSAAVQAGILLPPENREGLSAGFYLIDPHQKRIGKVFQGDLLAAMASACLDQMWLKGAGAHFVFLANLAAAQKVFGPRGFRYLMMDAGRLGELVYLNNSRSGWGACGIGAFYDREADAILDLNPESAMVYLVAAGTTKNR
jgi:SagB-type dehydrogenase family enzyme